MIAGPPNPDARSPPSGWLALFAILALSLPGLLFGIDQRLSSHTMENLAIVTSQETMYRIAQGERNAWLVTFNDGMPRLEKPPMVGWLSLLAWSDLDAAAAPPQQLIFRARCVSVAMGLIMLASIFLIARMLGDARFAALATLAIASTFFFQRQARTASYDIHYVAWTTLAIALGLWAMNPLGIAPSLVRRISGWVGCAIALFAAAMSKNPLPYLLALPTLITAIAMLSSRRASDARWLAAAALLSAAPVAWWYWHVYETYPSLARRALGREVTQPRSSYQPIWYYLGLFGLVVPWTLWLIGGLIEPFKISRQTPDRRRRVAMFPLLWFAMIFIIMSIPAAKQQRYILSILPAIGLLLAVFTRQHEERAARGEDDRVHRTISAAMWIAMAVASIAGAWFLAFQNQYVELASRWSEHAQAVVEPMPLALATALGVALLAICFIGWRAHANRPWRSSIAMGAWMIVLMTAFWRQEAGAVDQRVKVFADEAARIRAIIGDAPLRSLRITREDSQWQFNEEFRIYYGRLIQRIWPDEIQTWLETQPGDAFIVARSTDRAREIMLERGFECIDQVRIDRNELHDLWRRSPSAASTP